MKWRLDIWPCIYRGFRKNEMWVVHKKVWVSSSLYESHLPNILLFQLPDGAVGWVFWYLRHDRVRVE